MTKAKKGLSIGAAMKQRMDSQEPNISPAEAAPRPEGGQAPTLPAAEPDPLESFNTRLPRSLHRRLKVHTALEGLKIQEVVGRALVEYLERQDKKES